MSYINFIMSIYKYEVLDLYLCKTFLIVKLTPHGLSVWPKIWWLKASIIWRPQMLQKNWRVVTLPTQHNKKFDHNKFLEESCPPVATERQAVPPAARERQAVPPASPTFFTCTYIASKLQRSIYIYKMWYLKIFEIYVIQYVFVIRMPIIIELMFPSFIKCP